MTLTLQEGCYIFNGRRFDLQLNLQDGFVLDLSLNLTIIPVEAHALLVALVRICSEA